LIGWYRLRARRLLGCLICCLLAGWLIGRSIGGRNVFMCDYRRGFWIVWLDLLTTYTYTWTRGSVVGWGTMLQAGRSRDRIPMRWILFNWSNPSSRTMTLGSTQSLTEKSTRNLPGGKGRPARKADNFTAICESIV
jgi:hypothetical protein